MEILVGILIGVAIGVFARDILNKAHCLMQLGISARKKREEIDKGIKDLEEFINKDEGA